MENSFTLDGDDAGAEYHALDVEDVAVICNNDGDNGDAGLDGKVESALFEGQQYGVLGVAASAFGEHVDALLLALNLLGCAGHGGSRIFGVLAVDEDGAAEAHEPSEEGNVLQVRLGCDAAPFGEHGAEHEDVELGLVVADKDCGSSGAQNILGVVDFENDAGGQAHEEAETASCGPLRDALHANEGEDDGGKDTKYGAKQEADVGGQGASNEAGLGDDEGSHVEEAGEKGVAHEELDEITDNGGHVGRRMGDQWRKD